MARLRDRLLTTDPVMRARLVQAGLVLLALSAGAVALLMLAAGGQAPLRVAIGWALAVPFVAALIFAAVRSGWSRRLDDPALTLAQHVLAGLACAIAYAVSTGARGGFFLVLMLVLMATLLSATPGQMRLGSGVMVGAMALAIVQRARMRDGLPWAESVHLLLVATVLPAASVLATRLAAVRQRNLMQQRDLEVALARIRELATRDELTGLVNRRHLRELMEQEHQRCIRSGRTFCLAVLDIDEFRQVNDRHGRSIGDAVLRSLAHEAMRRVRVSDAFARWGGDRFVLLLADARGSLAKGGVERVRAGIAVMHVTVPGAELRLTLSAGLAEHHAGETVEQTLERAERALSEAKAAGRDRLVVAG